MTPFHVTYALSRLQRLRLELPQWLPAIAGGTGFAVGAAYLAATASSWFLLLLLIPLVAYRGLFRFLFELVARRGRPVELRAADGALEVRAGGAVAVLPLDGIFQVFRSGDVWTVLHLSGAVLTIPADAITADQIGYLRAFARRAHAARA
ncbi:MAG: hypothetical protein FJ304_01380 [Planctomycetes bacterium]|nr:hypothetical protein [Planctomycetota bacterium]